jgi:outer membrane protein TolC
MRAALLLAALPAVAAVAVASETAVASTSEPLRLSLAQAVQEALEKAPVVLVAGAQESAARHKATAVGRTRLGQAEAFATITRYQDDLLIRPLSLEMFQAAPPGPSPFASMPWDRNQLRYGLSYQVPLFTGGKLSAAVDLARLAADQAALLAAGTRWEVRANVAALYAGVQTLDAVALAVAQNEGALELAERTLSLMVEQGKRARLDLLKVQDELEEARARRASVAADATRLRALLLALLGRDPATPLTVDPLPERSPRLTAEEPELRELALAASAVRRGELALHQAEAGVHAARGALLPNLVARGALIENVGLEIGEQRRTWEVSAGLVVPVFSGGARLADLASARESERAAASARERARLEKLAQLQDALARLSATREALAAAVVRVKAAREAARVQQLRYDTGAGTVEDLLRARARELGADSAEAQARGELVAAGERLNAVCEREVVR